jgi:hypothetical protein
MSFFHLYARSPWQTIKQQIRQWVKPDNHSPIVNAARQRNALIATGAQRLAPHLFLGGNTKRWAHSTTPYRPLIDGPRTDSSPALGSPPTGRFDVPGKLE